MFTRHVASLIEDIERKQWSYGKVEVAVDEWTIHTPRRVRVNGTLVKAEDAVHKKGSRHHDGLGLDLLVYIDGEYVSNGDHPIWQELDIMAKAINPKFSFGIEFRDSNHLSWDEGD
jgi:hypothetical protein